MSRSIRCSLATALLGSAIWIGCAAGPQYPYHGFLTQTDLDKQDTYVIETSYKGTLDPANLAQEDQRYEHNGIAYNRMEEGYYQWGHKLYSMGYRDEFYVRDLAPKAFRHDLIDVYDHAIAQGFEDAEKDDPARKK